MTPIGISIRLQEGVRKSLQRREDGHTDTEGTISVLAATECSRLVFLTLRLIMTHSLVESSYPSRNPRP